MNTSPILAATSSPSTAGVSQSASADNSSFQRVLQQMGPSVNYAVSSKVTQAVSPCVSSTVSNAVPKVSSEVTSSVSPGVRLPPSVNSLPASPGVVSNVPGPPEKEETASVTGSLAARKDAKQATAAKEPKAKEAKEDRAKENRASSTAAAGATVAPIVAVATPAAPDVLSNLSLPADSVFTPEQSAITQTAELRFNPPAAFPSEPVTTSTAAERIALALSALPADFHATRIDPAATEPVSSAMRSNVDSSPAAQPQAAPKAKPQTVASSSTPPPSAAVSASSTTSDAASVSIASQHLLSSHPALAQETLANHNFAISHPALRTGALSDQTTHPRTQAATSSAAEEKTNGTAATSERDSSPSALSSASAHVQAVAAPASVSAITAAAQSAKQAATQSATQSGAQLATQSAPQSTAVVFAQPPFAQSSPAPAHAQLQSSPIPDPLRMVDSGQLRVTPNSSELKISVQLPELGKVEVRAVTAHDVTTAHLTAFRHDALPALAAGRNGLEQALKSRDVVLGSFDSHPQGHSGGQQRQQSFKTSAPSSGAASIPATTSATAEASSSGLLPDYSSISVRA